MWVDLDCLLEYSYLWQIIAKNNTVHIIDLLLPIDTENVQFGPVLGLKYTLLLFWLLNIDYYYTIGRKLHMWVFVIFLPEV